MSKGLFDPNLLSSIEQENPGAHKTLVALGNSLQQNVYHKGELDKKDEEISQLKARLAEPEQKAEQLPNPEDRPKKTIYTDFWWQTTAAKEGREEFMKEMTKRFETLLYEITALEVDDVDAKTVLDPISGKMVVVPLPESQRVSANPDVWCWIYAQLLGAKQLFSILTDNSYPQSVIKEVCKFLFSKEYNGTRAIIPAFFTAAQWTSMFSTPYSIVLWMQIMSDYGSVINAENLDKLTDIVNYLVGNKKYPWAGFVSIAELTNGALSPEFYGRKFLLTQSKSELFSDRPKRYVHLHFTLPPNLPLDDPESLNPTITLTDPELRLQRKVAAGIMVMVEVASDPPASSSYASSSSSTFKSSSYSYDVDNTD